MTILVLVRSSKTFSCLRHGVFNTKISRWTRRTRSRSMRTCSSSSIRAQSRGRRRSTTWYVVYVSIITSHCVTICASVGRRASPDSHHVSRELRQHRLHAPARSDICAKDAVQRAHALAKRVGGRSSSNGDGSLTPDLPSDTGCRKGVHQLRVSRRISALLASLGSHEFGL